MIFPLHFRYTGCIGGCDDMLMGILDVKGMSLEATSPMRWKTQTFFCVLIFQLSNSRGRNHSGYNPLGGI